MRPLSQLAARMRLLAPALPMAVAGVLVWTYSAEQILKWPAFEKAYLSRLIGAHEPDYLLKLRDTHLGCLTLEFRPADIVFIGDSHSYAGYDYALLQEKLRPAVVGSCALSGMFPDNVIDFVEAADSAGLLPEQLVFGISPEMFWEVDQRYAQTVERARREIARLDSPRESLVDLATGRFAVIPEFRDASDMRRALAKFDAGIAAVSDDVTDRFFRSYTGGVHALDYWIEAVRTARPNRDSIGIIRRLCETAHAHGTRLGVVFVPESRFLISRFSPEQREAFREVMAEFDCADWVEFSYFERGGGPDRWFVNRYLLEDYPYDAWLDPQAAVAWEAASPDERRWQFFDPDHMNPEGARAFSATVVEAMRAKPPKGR